MTNLCEIRFECGSTNQKECEFFRPCSKLDLCVYRSDKFDRDCGHCTNFDAMANALKNKKFF